MLHLEESLLYITLTMQLVENTENFFDLCNWQTVLRNVSVNRKSAF